MNLAYTLLILTSFAIGCQVNSTNSTKAESDRSAEKTVEEIDSSLVDTANLQINLIPEGNYNSLKAQIRQKKTSQNSKEDFENFLINQIIPHWYGTEWDFNGYTAIPRKGEIACGYFVSTTLEHLGIVINRYHLAQQAGLNEAKSLAIVDSNYFTVYGYETLEKRMQSMEDAIYFVGLDNHVGYLYKENGTLYFIHSNYIDDRVMIEKAQYSKAFQSNIYVVAELSTNALLRERWRTGTRVEVVRNQN